MALHPFACCLWGVAEVAEPITVLVVAAAESMRSRACQLLAEINSLSLSELVVPVAFTCSVAPTSKPRMGLQQPSAIPPPPIRRPVVKLVLRVASIRRAAPLEREARVPAVSLRLELAT